MSKSEQLTNTRKKNECKSKANTPDPMIMSDQTFYKQLVYLSFQKYRRLIWIKAYKIRTKEKQVH